jgi:hypothetical protein
MGELSEDEFSQQETSILEALQELEDDENGNGDD